MRGHFCIKSLFSSSASFSLEASSQQWLTSNWKTVQAIEKMYIFGDISCCMRLYHIFHEDFKIKVYINWKCDNK